MAVALAAFLLASGFVVYKYYRASHPTPEDVFYALMEYYHDLEAQLASGDRFALTELAARLKDGPHANVAHMVGDKLISGFPHPREMTYSECGEWILRNRDRLAFDSETGMFRLARTTSTGPALGEEP